MDRRVGGLRERERPGGSLNHFYGAFLPGFLWLIILICLVLNPCLVYLRVLPCVRAHLLAKMDSSEEAYGRLNITPFLTSKEPFCACIVGKVSLTLRMRNMWSLIWAGLSSSSSSSSWSISPQATNSSCSAWSPSTSCLSITREIFADVIKLRFLRGGDYPRLSMWVRCNHKAPDNRS